MSSATWDANRYPYYKRWAKDFLSSGRVLAMNHLQRSIYSILLDRSWVEDGLPTDMDELAILALCTPDEIREAWTQPLSGAFVETDGRLRNPKQEEVRAAMIRTSEGKAKGGRRGKPGATSGKRKSLSESSAKRKDSLHSESESESESDSPAERCGANAPAPPRAKKRINGKAELAAALDATPPEIRSWIEPHFERYRQARVDMKAPPWKSGRWREMVGLLAPRGEGFVRQRVRDAEASSWKRLWFPDDEQKSSQARPQGAQAGRWYKGPPLKDVEARQRRMKIHDRYRERAGNFMLSEEETLEMARADGDREMHEYDWMTGMRDDPPPRNGAVIDVTPGGGRR